MAPPLLEEVLPDSLQVHETLPTSTGIKGSFYKVVEPVNNIARQGAITFNWASDKDTFIDPYCTFIYIESIIKLRDGTLLDTGPADAGTGNDMVANSKVLTVNGLNHAWFNNVKVKINGTSVEMMNNKYTWRCDIETRLSFSKEVKEGHLKMCGFDEEDMVFDIVNANNIEWGWVVRGDAITQNHALARRFGIEMSSKVIRTIGCIHSSIFEQPKALPPFTELEVTFERNKDEFMLLSKNDDQHYWLQMQRKYVITCKMHLQESLSDDIMQVANAGKNYLYPIRRVRMVSYSKGPTVQEFLQTNILPGEEELPRCIFIVLVHTDATHGTYARDPFNYFMFGVNKVGLKIGGQDRPFPPFECHLGGNAPNYTLPLWGLLQSVQSFCGEQEIGITPLNFLQRNTIFGWDLTSTQLPSGLCYETTGKYTIDLIMTLENHLVYVINMIVYAEYNAEIELSGDGKVVLHNNA